MNVSMKSTQAVSFKGLPVLLEVLADTPQEALDAMARMIAALDGNVNVTAVAQIAKPVSAALAKADPSKEDKHAHDKAMRLLVDLYRDEKTRDMARALLAKYEVQKFGEIPVERGHELLADALKIKG